MSANLLHCQVFIKSCPHFIIIRTPNGTLLYTTSCTNLPLPSSFLALPQWISPFLEPVWFPVNLVTVSPHHLFSQFCAFSHADSHTDSSLPPRLCQPYPAPSFLSGTSPLPPDLVCFCCPDFSLLSCYVYTVTCHLLCHYFQVALYRYILSSQIDSKLFQGRNHTLSFLVSLTQGRIPLTIIYDKHLILMDLF